MLFHTPPGLTVFRPNGAQGCPPMPRVKRGGTPLRPSGAQGCSHGWSDAALSVAQPVEAGLMLSPAPAGAEQADDTGKLLRPAGVERKGMNDSPRVALRSPAATCAPPVATSRHPSGTQGIAPHSCSSAFARMTLPYTFTATAMLVSHPKTSTTFTHAVYFPGLGYSYPAVLTVTRLRSLRVR